MLVPRHGWVVLCDGAKALLMRNDGSSNRPRLVLADTFAQRHHATHDLGTERPGRVYQSHGAARSATEGTDLHDAGEVAFLAKVADTLDRAVREHGVTNLLLVAPPRALGVLRHQLTPAVQAAVIGDIAKDLVRLPTSEIEQHLAA